jgi:hypothetical protein
VKSAFKTGFVMVVLTAMLLVHLLVAWNSRALLRKGYADFTIFYAAGKIVGSGQGNHLYDPALQFQVEQSFAGSVSTRQATLPFNHPPFEALLFVPFTFLPCWAAYLVWGGINLVLLFLVPLILRPEIEILREHSPAFWLLLGLAFFPAFVSLWQGQDSLLFLLLVSCAFVRWQRGGEIAAGCFLGMASFRYHLLVILLLALILLKLGRVLAGFGATVIGLAAVSIGMVGWRAALAYPRFVWNQEEKLGRFSDIVQAMPNLRGLLALLGAGAQWAMVASVAVAAVGLLALVVVVRNSLATRTAAGSAVFSLSLVLSVIVSYHVLIHDLSILLFPIYMFLDRFGTHEIPRRWMQVALWGPMLALLFSPVPMLLWLRYHAAGILAVLLLIWFGAMLIDIGEGHDRKKVAAGSQPA